MNLFKAIANFFRKFLPLPKQPVPKRPVVNKPRPEPEDLPTLEIKTPGIDLVAFTEAIEKNFKLKLSSKQIDCILLIVRECEAQGLKIGDVGDNDECKVAYVFATAYHETNVKKAGGPLVPITEQGNFLYLSTRKYYPYIGRGFVQITWRENYQKYSKILGVDLVNNMELALDPQIAAKILVHGMIHGTFRPGHSLSDYFKSSINDPVNARYIINGRRAGHIYADRAHDIANYYFKFLDCLQESRRPLRPEVLA